MGLQSEGRTCEDVAVRDVGVSMTGPWVCGVCRSVNREVDSRCYSCRTPRAKALNPEARDATRREPATTEPLARATEARALGARYASSEGLAVVAQVGVLLVTAVTLAREVLTIVFIQGLDAVAADPAALDPSTALDQLSILSSLRYVVLGAWFLGIAAWGAWLARVVANVPALGGGWTSETPRFAFLSALIPGGNLYWTTATMRQAIAALSPAGGPRLGLLTTWWLALTPALILLLNIGPLRWLRSIIETVVSAFLLIASGGNVRVLLDSAVVVEVVGAGLLVAAAALAILLIQMIEGLQATRLRDLPAAGITPAPSG
jgi:hypothetical protein